MRKCPANTINVGADLGAIAAATNLLVPVPQVEAALGRDMTAEDQASALVRWSTAQESPALSHDERSTGEIATSVSRHHAMAQLWAFSTRRLRQARMACAGGLAGEASRVIALTSPRHRIVAYSFRRGRSSQSSWASSWLDRERDQQHSPPATRGTFLSEGRPAGKSSTLAEKHAQRLASALGYALT